SLSDAEISSLFSIPGEALPALRLIRREKGKGNGFRLPARVSKLRALPLRTFLAALEDQSLLLFRPFDDVLSPAVLGFHPDRITALTGASDWAASASADGSLFFWNLARPGLDFRSDLHKAEIVELLADKDRCFSLDAQGTVAGWRIRRGAKNPAGRWSMMWQTSLDSPVMAASLSAKNETIV